MTSSNPRAIDSGRRRQGAASSLTAALLGTSAGTLPGPGGFVGSATGGNVAFSDDRDVPAGFNTAHTPAESNSFGGNTPTGFMVGSPWGGSRSGASLFLRPAWGSNRHRQSIEGELHTRISYSLAEAPDQESDLSVDISRVSSQQLTHQVSGPLPPPGMPSHRFRASGDGSRGNGVTLDVPVGSSDVEAQRGFERQMTDASADNPHSDTKASATKAVYTATVYGLINGIVGLPTMISFVAIIFKDPTYRPWLGQLAKLGFFASGVHQAVFAIMSTLPYAVGQVQDVGLIFLSAMATSIATICSGSDRVALGTALTWLAISTVLVGIAIIAVGKRKWATLVQYMPIQVVGAYLGYVGYFCIAAGIGLGVSEDIGSIVSWRLLFGKLQLIKLVPTLASTFVLLLTLKCSRSPLALPAVLIAVPVAFHLVRIALGYSMADAIHSGWLLSSEGGSQPFWEVYELYNWHFETSFPFISGIAWSSMLRQIPSLIALFLVVTFGSALDVAAIQSDTPFPLDFNAEMVTVGTANVVAGVVGAGMTGSYIFSQTIFSMRAGVNNRLHGAIIAVMELALFFLPISVISYMPTLYYGSLLVMFGVDISNDWLVHSYQKVTRMEYCLLILTFFAILQFGLELGILGGLILSLIAFTFSYAQGHVESFTLLPSRSGVMRPYDHGICLEILGAHMVSLSVSGYLFFGSSLAISDKVFKVVDEMLQRDSMEAQSEEQQPGSIAHEGTDTVVDLDSSTHKGKASTHLEPRVKMLLPSCPRFIILDLKRVHGLDATAARTLGTLWATLQGKGVHLLFTSLHSAETVRLLRAHGIPLGEVADGRTKDLNDEALHFADLDVALRFCELTFLKVAESEGLCNLEQQSMTLSSILETHMQNPQPLYHEVVDAERAARDLQRVMQRRTLSPGEVLFQAGDASNEIFFVMQGSLRLQLSFQVEDRTRKALPGSVSGSSVTRSFEYPAGAILGQKDFLLGTPRTATATCGTAACTLYVVPRSSFDTLRQRRPEALIILTSVMLRAGAITEGHAVEMLGAAQM